MTDEERGRGTPYLRALWALATDDNVMRQLARRGVSEADAAMLNAAIKLATSDNPTLRAFATALDAAITEVAPGADTDDAKLRIARNLLSTRPLPELWRTARAYFATTALNLARDAWRRTARNVPLTEDVAAGPDPQDPATNAAGREIRELLRIAIRRLSKPEQRVLWMRARGTSYQQIAAAHGITAGTARKWVSRARGRLAQLLQELLHIS